MGKKGKKNKQQIHKQKRKKERKQQREKKRQPHGIEQENYPQDTILSPSGEVLKRVEYIITYDPLDVGHSPELQEMIITFHGNIQKNPKKNLPALLKAVEQYPHVSEFYNYITVAYGLLGDRENYRFWVEKTLKDHPYYLFGRIEMARVYLKEGKLDEAEGVFDHRLELKHLYPHRTVFHVTEVTHFYTVVIELLVAKGKLEEGRYLLEMIEDIDPDFQPLPYLRKLLYHSLLKRIRYHWRRSLRPEEE